MSHHQQHYSGLEQKHQEYKAKERLGMPMKGREGINSHGSVYNEHEPYPHHSQKQQQKQQQSMSGGAVPQKGVGGEASWVTSMRSRMKSNKVISLLHTLCPG